MGQSPEELRSEIAATRQGMSDTLEAIGDHVSPGRIIERRKNRFLYGVQSVRDRVMGTAGNATSSARGSVSDAGSSVADAARQAPDAVVERTQGSPLGAGAVAFGIGFLAAAVFPASRSEAEAAGQLMEKAEPLKDEVTAVGRQVADDLKEPAREAAESVRETATSGAEQVKQAATAGAEQVKDAASSGAEQVRSTAQDATSGGGQPEPPFPPQ